MTLIDLLKPWLIGRWPDISITESTIPNAFIVSTRFNWVAKIFEDRVDVRTPGINNCICCSTKKTLYACDPTFFQQLEVDVKAVVK